MTREKANRAQELLGLIHELRNFKEYFSDREYGSTAHFELHSHYGSNSNKIKFDRRLNERFIPIVENVLKEYNDELDSL